MSIQPEINNGQVAMGMQLAEVVQALHANPAPAAVLPVIAPEPVPANVVPSAAQVQQANLVRRYDEQRRAARAASVAAAQAARQQARANNPMPAVARTLFN